MFKKVYSLYSAFYPSLRFTLSSLQSAFFTLSLHFTPSPQSAVRSLRFTLTVQKTPPLNRLTVSDQFRL